MISVIIPLYNKEKAIRNTIESVLKQTFEDFELIIVDDGGTDNSAAIAKEIAAKDSRIYYYYKQNGGVSSARNEGLAKAKGEWVVFLDADDEMLPNNLEYLYNLILEYNVNVGSANVIIQNDNGKHKLNLRLKKTPIIYRNFIKAILKKQAIFSTGAVIYNRKILGINPYNEKLCRYEDAEFELKIFNKYPIVMSPEPVLIHHAEFSELSHLRNGDTEKDFIFNMNFKSSTLWQKVQLGRFLCEGCYTYPNGKEQMKKLYGFYYYWLYIYIIIRKIYSIIK